jgi:hypothetical protein
MRIYAGADEPCITRDHVFFLRNEPVCGMNLFAFETFKWLRS